MCGAAGPAGTRTLQPGRAAAVFYQRGYAGPPV